jgi:hypothetical protein
LNLLGLTARCRKNGRFAHLKFEQSAPNGRNYLAVTPCQIIQQNCLQRAGGP